MKTSIKYTLIATIAFGAFSCTDLDEKITANYTANFSPNNLLIGNKNNVTKATPNDNLNGAFARLLNGTATNGGFFQVQELASDEALIPQRGGDWFDGGVYIKAHKHDFSSGSTSINGAWQDAYNGIIQCNDLLTNGIGGTPMSAPQVAQLRTLRAFFYWRLLDVFGNVKIVTVANQDAPQKTRLEVFNFVESELLAALPGLPAGKQEYGRLNQAGAQALLCRLYLNAGVYTGTPRWADAITYGQAVINSGIYTLEPNYAKIFSPDNVENSEHIFVAPFDEATGEGMTIAQMTLHYPSQLTYRLAEQPWNGYAAMEDFYNSYDAADKRKANNFIVGPQKDIAGNPILDLAFDKADEDGAPINYTAKINMLEPNASRQAGARLGKFSFKIGQFNNMDNDFPLLRLSEVYLNVAEALVRSGGNTTTALNYVNLIRARAGVPAYTLADIAIPAQATISNKFLAERGRELFIEHLRRPDLIRFGAWGDAWWEKPAHAPTAKILMAIPIEQISASAAPYKLVQNPEYQ